MRRPPALATVKYKDHMGREHRTLVHAADRRELDELRKVLKHLNRRLTVPRMETISVETAKAMAWRELSSLPWADVRGLLRHPEALDAVAECAD